MKTLKMLSLLTIVCFSSFSFAQVMEPSKQFHHVLLFKWADSLDISAKNEVMTLFKELPSKVEGFNNINILDLAMSSDGFDTLFIMRFASKEAQDIYQQHPDHKRIQAIAPPLIAKFSEFDYWE
jgi:hypothetical protein